MYKLLIRNNFLYVTFLAIGATLFGSFMGAGVKLLSDELQAPIIITFKQPQDSNFNFKKFYNALSEKNFLIYPGKLTVAETFRVGCIGNLNEDDMKETIIAIKDTLEELEINIK